MFKLWMNSGNSSNTVDYSVDGGNTWTALASNTDTESLNKGTIVKWRSTLTPGKTFDNYGLGRFFVNNKSFNIFGNIMSMLFGDSFINQTSLSGKDYAFYGLFAYCRIIDAEHLILPAMTTSSFCYSRMFLGCSSLTKAPAVLPATNLSAQRIYEQMFDSCTSLVQPPVIKAIVMSGTYQMNKMFYGCTSLTYAPDLLCTGSKSNCYNQMFYGCPRLSYVKCLLKETNASSCLWEWLNGVSSIGTFIKNDEATWTTTGISGIPTNWTVKYDSVTATKIDNAVSSTTTGLKIEVVQSLPASPDANTIYVIQ